MEKQPFLFAPNASREFDDKVALRLGTALADHKEREFEGVAQKTCPLVEVGNRDVYAVWRLHGFSNDRL